MIPTIAFDGTLTELRVRKVVDGDPPLWIYDAMFQITGTEPPIPVQIMRHGQSSLEQKLGRTFAVRNATLRFENGERPPPAARVFLKWLRNHTDDEYKVERRALLDYITSLQIELAQTRMVIQVSDVKEIHR